MELLLNFAWLLLALPAYWLWRGSRGPCPQRRFSPWQCLLALGCLLVLLFPVVSATDDLRAMRAEAEESPAGKRSNVRPASGDKSSPWTSQTQPALAAITASFASSDRDRLPLPTLQSPIAPGPVIQRTGRAPPFSLLG
jgi:hypothetical protein